ncbi:MAG: SPOR domain-containing protein [Novosphingobium sp.]
MALAIADGFAAKAGWIAPAFAQTSAARRLPGLASEQPPPGRGAARLDAALGRLGRDPRDLEALIDAGGAAIEMGDIEAAIGFFNRADQVVPRNARVLAGLARARARSNDPVAAIALFEQARKAGASESMLAGDRGLAYDLVGDNARAQSDYRLALANGTDAEVVRRLALSQAIAGDQNAAEATLLPLLQLQDKAGWRTRAFVLAILGQPDQAVTVARSLLPPDLATAIAPYLRYMPRLTRAQQAAAANFGAFPRASEIGIDDPRIASISLPARPGARSPGADGQLVPSGEPLGRRLRAAGEEPGAREQRGRDAKAAALAARAAPPEPLPTRQAGAPAELTASRAPIVADAQVATSRAAPTPAPGERSVPGLSRIAEPGRTPAPLAAAPALRISLSEAFSDLGKPGPAARAPGAVDITRVAPASTKPAQLARTAPKPPPPTHPSRIWVQLGIGRDKPALGWDWRRLARQAPDSFKGRRPFVSDSGPSNRMLAGPFGSEAEASAFVAELEKARVVGPFIWVSPAGQVVDSLEER